MTNAKPDLKFDCLVHDLNNVFQTVIDAADLIGSDPNWAPVSAMILRSIQQGRRIVSSLMEKEQNAIPLEILVENAIAFATDFVNSIKGPALGFTREIPPNLFVGLASSALERVLVNLFINASQAAASARMAECRIGVSAFQHDGSVELLVSDNGPGIPEDVLPVIFMPRFSTDCNRSGLGLHIVHSLVTEAGGSVSAETAEGGGAIFRIVLPLARKHLAATI
jgi:signal transduction histidine kinase